MSGTATPQLESLPSAVPAPFADQDPASDIVYLRGSDALIYQKSYYNGKWASSFEQVVVPDYVLDLAPVDGFNGQLIVRTTDYEVVPLIGNFSTSEAGNLSYHLSASTPGGYFTSGIEVVNNNNAAVWAYMIGFDGILYQTIWSRNSSSAGTLADGWSKWLWFSVDDNSTADWYNYTPAAVISGYGGGNHRYDVFGVRRVDDALWVRTSSDGVLWLSALNLGGVCTGGPVVRNFRRDNTSLSMLIVVRGGDGRLWFTFYEAGIGWSGFKPVGEGVPVFVGEPFVLPEWESSIDVLVCGLDGGIWQSNSSTGAGGLGRGWSTWTSLGGDFQSSPKAISTVDGRIDAFVVGRQGQLMLKRRDEGSPRRMEGWQDLGPPP